MELGETSVDLTPGDDRGEVVAVFDRGVDDDTSPDPGGVDIVRHGLDSAGDVHALDTGEVEGLAAPTGDGVWVVGRPVRSLAAPDVGVVDGRGGDSDECVSGPECGDRPIVVNGERLRAAVGSGDRGCHGRGYGGGWCSIRTHGVLSDGAASWLRSRCCSLTQTSSASHC